MSVVISKQLTYTKLEELLNPSWWERFNSSSI